MKSVLSRISPAMEERREVDETVLELKKITKDEFKGLGLDLKVNVYGSVSKDTWLSQEKDIDLFVGFPTSYSKGDMEGAVTTVGKRLLDSPIKKFAEHPYIMGKYHGHSVEIVPYYDVRDPSLRLSAVDRTPFHDEYVKEHLRGREDEVRLLKKFMKGIGVYGAEVRVEGFSGYLCELMIILYGSFNSTLEEASNWQQPLVLSLTGPADQEAFESSPMTFVDPTDPGRNVASALNIQNLSLFIYAAKCFLKDPDERFFFPVKREVSVDEVTEWWEERGTHLLSLRFQTPDVIDDILYSQIKKAKGRLVKQLKEAGFLPLNSAYSIGGSVTIAFELERKTLPAAHLHMGPRVNSTNEEDFLNKHRCSKSALTPPFIRDDRWMVHLKRKHLTAEDFLNFMLSQKDLKSRGMPSHLARAVEKGFKLVTDAEAIKDDTGIYAQMFKPIFPWEAGDG